MRITVALYFPDTKIRGAYKLCGSDVYIYFDTKMIYSEVYGYVHSL